MSASRPITLLRLATVATAAVMPVLLAVLLVVATTREAESDRPARNSDRHVSVRNLAALKTFEYAIVRRDRASAPMPSAESLLARLPQCRGEWDGHPGFAARLRGLLLDTPESGLSPAARMALQLEEIDQALLRFSSGANRRVTEKVGLDGNRWLAAAATALQTPVETPEYPGRRFFVRCSDIAGAVTALARANGRMLSALAWRGTEVERVIARWRPEQFVEISPRQVARVNPWTGIPGCVYLAHASASYYVGGVRALDDRLCTRPEMLGRDAERTRATRIAGDPTPDMPIDDPRWKLPPSLGMMLQPLETLQRPGRTLYRAYTEQPANPDADPASYSYGPNKIDIGGSAVDVGFSVDVTIDPEVQALAQQTAACYTGHADVCRALAMQRKEDGARGVGHLLLERAMVRMAAVAIVDVASGRIEALAGALSKCTREEYDGPGRSSRCDKRMPYPIRYRPDALLNPAVFHDAMPASTIKPIMAAAFLSDPVVGPRWLAGERAEMARGGQAVPSYGSLRAQLMRSDSARFLDRMFCADKNFPACARIWEVQAMARAFGWNGGCTIPRDDCGKIDLLFGRGVDVSAEGGIHPLAMVVPYGRLLTEPLGSKLGAPFHVRAETPLDGNKVRQCAAGPDGRRGTKDDWEKCSGATVVDVVAEGWGQGHARATALGSAGMMAMVAAAANGQGEVRKPHLVERVRGAGPAEASTLKSAITRWGLDAPEPNRIAPDAAQVILNGLSFGHRAGTSRLACEQVFDPRTCQSIDWIAGKTGTPTFPNDDRSLDDLKRLCAKGRPKTRQDQIACGPLRPYKWYVAAYRTDKNDPRWTKVIAVLTERNWIAATGRVHGAGDHGPNPAAEIAMQIAGRHVGALPGGAP